ncbi:MAG TPA: long-chain fatty acid--CoA ligase [Firmicutes bacterium]|nr:long-chain fatty acid--CoA ligase [Bacillota bacterium]
MEKWLAYYEKNLPQHLIYPSTTLVDLLNISSAKYPGCPAMVYLDHTWSYQELNALVSRMANALIALGIHPGDRVGIHLPNCPQFVIGYYGALRAGAIAVSINPLFSGDDLSFIIEDSGLQVVITSTDLYPALEKLNLEGLKILVTNIHEVFSPTSNQKTPVGSGESVFNLENYLFAQPETDPGITITPDQIANLQYTGGTTGRSKGAVLTHRNLVANAVQFRVWLQNVFEDGDGRFIAVIPLFHIYGLTTCMNTPILTGSTILLLSKFDINELMRVIDKYKPNIFNGVPAMYGALVIRESEYDMSSIKACVSGSAPLPPAIQEKFEELTGGKLVEGYGLSEASPIVTINPIYGKVKIGSIGVPIFDTCVKVMNPQTGEDITHTGEIGELVVKGPQVMQGYWRQPEETELVLKDGWLRTGDLVRMDEEGYIFVADRLKDMIIMGGEKIYPREIEDLLYTHPAVREVAVVGVPHPLRGEVPQAYVALKESAAASEKELRQFCFNHLSKFKVPKIKIVEALPRNSVGKVLRRLLREESEAQ